MLTRPLSAPTELRPSQDETGFVRNLRDFTGLLVRDRAGLIGLVLFLIVVLAAIFAPWIAPYEPTAQNLKESKLPPAWLDQGTSGSPAGYR